MQVSTTADEVRQVWYGRLGRYAETIAEIIPESDAEFGGDARHPRKASRPSTLRVPPRTLRLVA